MAIVSGAELDEDCAEDEEEDEEDGEDEDEELELFGWFWPVRTPMLASDTAVKPTRKRERKAGENFIPGNTTLNNSASYISSLSAFRCNVNE